MRQIPVEDNSPASAVARKSLLTQKQEHVFWVKGEDHLVYFSLNPEIDYELCFSLYNKKTGLAGVLALQRAIYDFDSNDIAFVEIISRNFSLAFERAVIFEDLNFKSTVAAETAWAANIAHELNNEIGKIVSSAYLIRNISSEDTNVKDLAATIEKAALNLRGVNPFTARSKEVFVVDSQLVTIIEKYKRDITINYHLNAPGAKIIAAPVQFAFVFKQLLNNSIRAMNNIENKKILVKTHIVDNQNIEILFQDFGPGFGDIDQSFVFHRQFTTKESGGYGLLFVRQLIEDMGGTIALLPYKLGDGAVFQIHLPIVNAK